MKIRNLLMFLIAVIIFSSLMFANGLSANTTTTTIPQKECRATDPPFTYPNQGNDPLEGGETICPGGTCKDECKVDGITLSECYCPELYGKCEEKDINCIDVCKGKYGLLATGYCAEKQIQSIYYDPGKLISVGYCLCVLVDTTTTTIYQYKQCIATDPPICDPSNPNTYPCGFDPFVMGRTECPGNRPGEYCKDECHGNILDECSCETIYGICKHDNIDCTDWKNTICDINMGACHCNIIGDLNGDRRVNIIDIAIIARAYGSYPGHPKWNSAANLNGDNVINIIDVAIAAKNYGNNCDCKQGTYNPQTGKCEVRISFTGHVVLISETFNIMVVLTTLIVLVFLFGLFKIRTKK